MPNHLHKPNVRHANPCPPCPKTAKPWEKFIYWLGIGLGSGLPKWAAGTWGTLGGLLFAVPFLCGGLWGIGTLVLMGLLAGSYICGKTSELMNVHDDPHIVWDEWVGMWITLLPIVHFGSFGGESRFFWCSYPVLCVLGFMLFRFFDIVKPFPITWVDRNVGGGFGILIDDVLAGLMSVAVLYLLCLLIL